MTDLIHKVKSLLGFKPQEERPCTPEEAVAIMAKCQMASFLEDVLFDRYYETLNGRQFDFGEFALYAGKHWNMDYDPYGYKEQYMRLKSNDQSDP